MNSGKLEREGALRLNGRLQCLAIAVALLPERPRCHATLHIEILYNGRWEGLMEGRNETKALRAMGEMVHQSLAGMDFNEARWTLGS